MDFDRPRCLPVFSAAFLRVLRDSSSRPADRRAEYAGSTRKLSLLAVVAFALRQPAIRGPDFHPGIHSVRRRP